MENSSAIIFKRRRIVAYLDDLLTKLPPGGKLPGERELIRTTGVGRTLLERALRRLENQGRIHCKLRQGYFRSPTAAPPRVLLLHEAHYPARTPGFTDRLIENMAALARRRGLPMQCASAADMRETELLALLHDNAAEYIFLLGLRDRPRAKLIRGEARYCVELLPRHAASLGAELRNAPISALQLEYLFQRGYTKIAYIHQAEDWNNTPTQLVRLLDYYRIMSEKHLPVHPEWVFQYAYDWKKLNRDMHRMMNSRQPPEALIAPGSSMAYLYRYCAGNGMKIGSELAIIGCDDAAPDLIPRPTTVTNDPEEIAKQAWDIMDALCRGIEKREVTRPGIVTGTTVPPLTADARSACGSGRKRKTPENP